VDRKGKFSSSKVWRNEAQIHLYYKKSTPGVDFLKKEVVERHCAQLFD
jgi:hypothetical protein